MTVFIGHECSGLDLYGNLFARANLAVDVHRGQLHTIIDIIERWVINIVGSSAGRVASAVA